MPAPRAPMPSKGSVERLARTLLHRPTLMILIYSLCLVLVGITASAQAGVITLKYRQTALESIIGDDAQLVRAVVNLELRVSDLPPAGPSDERRSQLAAILDALVAKSGMLRVELREPQGTILATSTVLPPGLPDDAAVRNAAVEARHASAELVDTTGLPIGADTSAGTLIREELPLVSGDQGVRAVVTIWRDASPILAIVDQMRREVVLLTVSAAIVLAIVLTFVFHSAQVRIHRQTAALVEASRRDPLTGLLNHGAIVETLSGDLLAARIDGEPVAVGLVDIDNFQMINTTHGHDAGDEALVAVATRLGQSVPEAVQIGRYGPDELLVYGRYTSAVLTTMLQDAQRAVTGIALRHVEGDAIPVTFSAGIAESPLDAAGVTELLSLAAQALASAKASGGDAIRTNAVEVGAAQARTFDVFEGLVIAIDTKDRYTKRHSEDVARYGLFIADVMGLDAELTRALRVAGLLHDVGKIGIPDGILRRPGRLTAEEMSIVQQHVALGDMILRDLPDIDLVRAGVRHHHERWDGKGYLHGLAGPEIPMIARVLAVGDAFSAMTTTRPYRKALSVREALLRLTDAAGSQLDESVVLAFVTAMERHPSAPLPGSSASSLWLPQPLALPAEVAA